MRAPHRIAEVLAAVETQTPYGGLSTSYETLGWTWVAMAARGARGVEEDATVETALAETRVDPRLIAGRRLRVSGVDWRIDAVDETAGGRVRLKLERSR